MPGEQLRRPAWAEISASALTNNVRALKSVLGASALCAVVKANGYGHGAPLVANVLSAAGVDYFAVATVDEGIELRESGVSTPILLLVEISPLALADALAHTLTLTIGSIEGAHAAAAAASKLGGRHRVHVKVDTGMGRMGVASAAVDEVVDILSDATPIDLEGIYTHFSVADSARPEDRQFTRHQIEQFDSLVRGLEHRGRAPRVVHMANSAGALAYPESRWSMARSGLALYGYLPEGWLASALEEAGVCLRPVMTLRARVSAVRRLDTGDRPSYGRRRALDSPSNIATVPFGYADGYPRRLFAAGAEVLIGARRYPLAGSVTMDQLVVDCGDGEVAVGDDVVLLGRQGDQEITADEWAQRGGTIAWEILCGVSARVPRVLVD